MNRIEKYNEVLGLTRSVNAEELKKLYRDRAKTLHPDRNSNPSSQEQFVLLVEAYEFYRQMLLQVEEKQRSDVFKSNKYPNHYYKEKWNTEKRMEARRKAAERAKMKYKHFEKMGYYKKLDKLFLAFDVLRFFLALIILFCLPVFMFFQDQFRGLIIALFLQLITYKLWSRPIKRFLSPD